MKVQILFSNLILLFSLNVFGQTAEELLDFGKKQVYEGNYSKAIKYYDKALKINPNFAEAYYHRANAKYDLKDYEGSMADCRKALNLNPELKSAYFNLGLSEYHLKDYRGAILNFTKAITIDKDDSEALYWRAKAYMALNKKIKACEDWKEAEKLGNKYAKNAYYQHCVEENQAEY